MKKIGISLIVTIITLSLVTNMYAVADVNDTFNTHATIDDTVKTILSSKIIIKDHSDTLVYDSAQTSNPRSDSYIWDGETLGVSTVIEDLDGENDFLSYYITAVVVNDSSESQEYIIPLILQHYNDPPSNTQALFYGETTIFSHQCLHSVSLHDGYEIYLEQIFTPLYLNPEISTEFSQDDINWSGLTLGIQNHPAYHNPYSYTVKAACIDYLQQPVSVLIDYTLNISGTDMTNIGAQTDIIPCSNIEYAQTTSYSPLPLNPSVDTLGQFVAYNPVNLNFRISIPTGISKGDYYGNIYFDVRAI